MKSLQKGFTLIELMIVVAIIGILAAVALPAYQDYTIRSKVTELVLQAGSYKVSIAESYAANSTFTASGNGLVVSALGKISGGSIGTDTGVVTVSGSNTSVGTAVNVVLSPVADTASGKLVWQCGTGGNTSMWKFVPAECRH